MGEAMRKFLLGFLCLFLCCCTACSSAAAGPSEPILNFQCGAELTYGEQVATASLDCSTQGMIRFTREQLSMIWNGEGFTLGGADLEKSYSSCPLPKDSALVLLHDLIVYSAQEGSLTHAGGSTWKGFLDGYEFSLTVDARGLPQRISMPQKQLTVDFYNFTS